MSDDLISRQDAIDALRALEEPAPTAQHLSAIYDCEDVIARVPSVQSTQTNTQPTQSCVKPTQSCVKPTQDCISRQDALDALCFMGSEDEGGITVSKANVSSMLRILPSAQPEREKGRWICVTSDESLEEEYECSKCKWVLALLNKTNYCPNCGVEMIEE